MLMNKIAEYEQATYANNDFNQDITTTQNNIRASLHSNHATNAPPATQDGQPVQSKKTLNHSTLQKKGSMNRKQSKKNLET